MRQSHVLEEKRLAVKADLAEETDELGDAFRLLDISTRLHRYDFIVNVSDVTLKAPFIAGTVLALPAVEVLNQLMNDLDVP